MKRSTKARAIALCAVVVAGLGVTAVTRSALAAEGGTGDFELPAGAPNPGPGFHILMASKVLPGGEQIYTCQADGTWAAKSVPFANLENYADGSIVNHREGPTWMSTSDGSKVLGTNQADKAVAHDGTIPWLLLTTELVQGDAGGELGQVTHISRVNTTGGVDLEHDVRGGGVCDPATDTTYGVGYTADYVFWVKD